MSEQLMSDARRILAALVEIVGNPTSNLTVAVFLLSAVAIVLLMVVLVVVMAVLAPAKGSPKPSRRRPSPNESEAVRAAKRKGSAWSFAALVILAMLMTSVLTGQDWYCVSCHSASAADEDVDDEAHGEVRCVRCHEDGRAPAFNTITRIAELGTQVGIWGSPYAGGVRTQRCMGCHTKQVAAVFTNPDSGIRMSHAEPLEAGWTCLQCHEGVGHSRTLLRAKMSSCLACHDSLMASADCVLCHTKDTTLASSLREERIYGSAEIVTRDCEGCHSSKKCDDCHGLRMPHSDEFLVQHPRYAGFDKKELCFEQCHTERDCGKCHGPWNSHGPDFKIQHQRLPRDAVCSTCHNRHEGTMCGLCHDF